MSLKALIHAAYIQKCRALMSSMTTLAGWPDRKGRITLKRNDTNQAPATCFTKKQLTVITPEDVYTIPRNPDGPAPASSDRRELSRLHTALLRDWAEFQSVA